MRQSTCQTREPSTSGTNMEPFRQPMVEFSTCLPESNSRGTPTWSSPPTQNGSTHPPHRITGCTNWKSSAANTRDGWTAIAFANRFDRCWMMTRDEDHYCRLSLSRSPSICTVADQSCSKALIGIPTAPFSIGNTRQFAPDRSGENHGHILSAIARSLPQPLSGTSASCGGSPD